MENLFKPVNGKAKISLFAGLASYLPWLYLVPLIVSSKESSPETMAGFFFSICGIPWIVAIMNAIVNGFVALREIKSSYEAGKVFAITGLFLGFGHVPLVILLQIVRIFFDQ